MMEKEIEKYIVNIDIYFCIKNKIVRFGNIFVVNTNSHLLHMIYICQLGLGKSV